MGNKNFEDQIDRAVVAYRKKVTNYYKAKKMRDLLLVKKDYIKNRAKVDNSDVSEKLKEINRELKVIDNQLHNTLFVKVECNPIFEVGYETLLNAIRKHLCTMFKKDDIKQVFDVVETKKFEAHYIYDDDSYRQTYSVGYIANGKDYLLPESKPIYSYSEKTAYEALIDDKREMNVLELMDNQQKWYSSEDWQEIFWGLVKQNLIKELKHGVKHYKEEMADVKRVYKEDVNEIRGKIKKLQTQYNVELGVLDESDEDELE